MKKKSVLLLFIFLAVIVLNSACSTKEPEQQKTGQADSPKDSAGLEVYNPLGQPPAIERVPMASRIDDLKGKTIYIVDIGFSGTHQFLVELQNLLKEKYSDTTWVLRDKIGTYFNDDPKLWAEIKEKGDGMIMGVGH